MYLYIQIFKDEDLYIYMHLYFCMYKYMYIFRDLESGLS